MLLLWRDDNSMSAILILVKIIMQNVVNRDVSSIEYGFESGMIKIAAKIAVVIAKSTKFRDCNNKYTHFRSISFFFRETQ